MAVTITNDAATTRTNLGLGDAATKTIGTASGNIPVLDSAGKLASGRMPTLKTVGGSSIIGSGDIATLPSGGTANQVLTSDSSSNATWADAAGGGKLLQVGYNDVFYTTGTWTDTSNKVLVSFSFTPLSATSTLHITASCKLQLYGNNSGNTIDYAVRLKEDATVLEYPNGLHHNMYSSTTFHLTKSTDVSHVRASNSTSARTYQLETQRSGSGTVRMGNSSSYGKHFIQIMEVEA